MPNRIIKESIRTSYEVDGLSYEAEVTFYRLLTLADDFGRFQGDPRVLQSSLFPLRSSIRSADFTRWIVELARADLTRLYTHKGKPYGYFPKWAVHQNTRATKSRFPEPSGPYYTSMDELMKAAESGRKHMNSYDSNCKQVHADAPVLDTRTRYSLLDTRERGARARDGPDGPEEFKPPTMDQVLQYAGVHAIAEKVAREFYWHYDGTGWEDKHGRPIKNWTSWLNKWQSREAQYKLSNHANHNRKTRGDIRVDQLRDNHPW